MNFEFIKTSDGTQNLRIGTSDNFNSANRFLVHVNGRSEWAEKYRNLPVDLNVAQGTGFLTYDHRGQGASEGVRAWISDYDLFARDLKVVLDHKVGTRPYNLVCHSMGGLIALVAAMKGYIQPRCLVLSSPLLGMPHKPVPAGLAYQASKFLTRLKLGSVNTGSGQFWHEPFEENVLTHSSEHYSIIQNSPYPVPSPTFEWVKASYEATQFVAKPENIMKLTMPVLVLCGGKEQVVDPNAVSRWVLLATEAGHKKVSYHRINGGYHELLIESKEFSEPTFAIIRKWFDELGFPI